MKIDITKDGKKVASVRIDDNVVIGWPHEEIIWLANAIFWEKFMKILAPGEIRFNPWEKTERIKEEVKYYRKRL